MKLNKILPLAATITGSLAILISSCGPPPAAINSDGSLKPTRQVSSGLVTQGFKKFDQYKRKYPRSRNAAYNAQLNRVASKLTRVINMPQAQWEFVVFENKSPNAFALPGGKVGVNSGMFQVTKTDAGLAAVVGHEIAHVTLNHASARMKRAGMTAIGGVLLDQILKSQGASKNQRLGAIGAYGTATTIGSTLPFSREQELQADRIGAVYMAKAGYHPQEAISMWQRFKSYKAASGNRRTPEFLSTHPLDTNRIQQLHSFMPIAMKSYRR